MKKKILIGVGFAAQPLSAAGNSLAFLQWVLGFRELGWDVWVVEEITPDQCVDSTYQTVPFADSTNRTWWDTLLRDHGLEEQASLFTGTPPSNIRSLEQFLSDTPVFLNISGHFKRHEILASIPHRIYLDLDPGFTQLWASEFSDKCDMNFKGHNHFFTVGLNVNDRNPKIPKTGIDWQPTLPPVSLPYWPPVDNTSLPSNTSWTTITHWWGYNEIAWNGITFGNKSGEFEKIRPLPQHVDSSLSIASDLTSAQAERDLFKTSGWEMLYAPDICGGIATYKAFLHASRGEISPAKSGYVHTESAWFSDRTACYLALGKPAVVQETGWSNFLPVSGGILPFHDLSTAAEGIRAIEADYPFHAQAARQFAETHLDARKVITRLLHRANIE